LNGPSDKKKKKKEDIPKAEEEFEMAGREEEDVENPLVRRPMKC
jgi:hypothetical protein